MVTNSLKISWVKKKIPHIHVWHHLAVAQQHLFGVDQVVAYDLWNVVPLYKFSVKSSVTGALIQSIPKMLNG